jgi:hypothetical protein
LLKKLEKTKVKIVKTRFGTVEQKIDAKNSWLTTELDLVDECVDRWVRVKPVVRIIILRLFGRDKDGTTFLPCGIKYKNVRQKIE